MTLCFYFIGGGLGACSTLAISPIINLTCWLGKPFLHPVQGPFGVFIVSAFLRGSISFWSNSGLLQTIFPISKCIYYAVLG